MPASTQRRLDGFYQLMATKLSSVNTKQHKDEGKRWTISLIEFRLRDNDLSTVTQLGNRNWTNRFHPKIPTYSLDTKPQEQDLIVRLKLLGFLHLKDSKNRTGSRFYFTDNVGRG